MTAPDLLAVLTRADQRWATKQADDPAPTNYLEHLAAALSPLLQPGGAAVDLDQVAEVEQLRTERDTAVNLHRMAAEDLAAYDVQWTERTAELEQLREERERALAQRHTANLNYEASRQEHLRTLEHLGRLVDAINEEWHPDGDVAAQVDRAIQLVAAAHDQLQQRHDDGGHVHQYPRNPSTGRINPCGCGHKIPKTARASLTGPTKGAA